MKLMRITLNYPLYLDDFNSRHGSDEEKSYQSRQENLVADLFGWSDFLQRNLEKDYGWKVWEPVTNFQSLQMRWLEECGEALAQGEDWFLSIVKKQICFFQPEILFVDSYSAFQPEFLRNLRRNCPSIKLILGWCGAPCSDYRVFEGFDLVLSNLPNLVKELRDTGHDAELLPHGFETGILEAVAGPTQFSGREKELTFTGSVVAGKKYHDVRLELLNELMADNLPIEVYAVIADSSQSPGLKSILKSLLKGEGFSPGNDRARREKFGELKNHSRPPVFGREMYALLMNSKLTLNNHIGVSQGHASNTRMYQATGCGSCLVTDWQPDLNQYFVPDEEVVTFKSPAEASEKIQYLLNHPEEAEKIATAGLARTLASHSFADRCHKLVSLIEARI